MNNIPLGFGPAPKTTYVFVDFDKSPSGWYTLDENDNPVPIEGEALTGYLANVQHHVSGADGEDNAKLQFTFNCGPRTYVIQTGRTTLLARDILGTLALIVRRKPEVLKKLVLSVELSKGNRLSAVFANVYNAARGMRIKAERAGKDEVDTIVTQVQQALGVSQKEPAGAGAA